MGEALITRRGGSSEYVEMDGNWELIISGSKSIGTTYATIEFTTPEPLSNYRHVKLVASLDWTSTGTPTSSYMGTPWTYLYGLNSVGSYVTLLDPTAWVIISKNKDSASGTYYVEAYVRLNLNVGDTACWVYQQYSQGSLGDVTIGDSDYAIGFDGTTYKISSPVTVYDRDMNGATMKAGTFNWAIYGIK